MIDWNGCLSQTVCVRVAVLCVHHVNRQPSLSPLLSTFESLSLSSLTQQPSLMAASAPFATDCNVQAPCARSTARARCLHTRTSTALGGHEFNVLQFYGVAPPPVPVPPPPHRRAQRKAGVEERARSGARSRSRSARIVAPVVPPPLPPCARPSNSRSSASSPASPVSASVAARSTTGPTQRRGAATRPAGLPSESFRVLLPQYPPAAQPQPNPHPHQHVVGVPHASPAHTQALVRRLRMTPVHSYSLAHGTNERTRSPSRRQPQPHCKQAPRQTARDFLHDARSSHAVTARQTENMLVMNPEFTMRARRAQPGPWSRAYVPMCECVCSLHHVACRMSL